jgi:hypothetical protein
MLAVGSTSTISHVGCLAFDHIVLSRAPGAANGRGRAAAELRHGAAGDSAVAGRRCLPVTCNVVKE